jgi:O-antigen/teichoic acid export membrane protein
MAVAARGLTTVILLATPPVFLSFGSPALLGSWLVLVAVPSTFNLLDLGIPAMAGSYMAMAYARGDLREYAATFWTSISYSLIIFPFLLVALIVFRGDVVKLAGGNYDATFLSLLVCAMVLQAQLVSNLFNAIRARGQITVWQTMDMLTKAAEFGGVIVALAATRSLIVCMGTALVVRLVCLLISAALLVRDDQGRALLSAGPGWATMRSLALPSTLYTLSALSGLGYLQLPIIMLGTMLGTAASAAYNSLRTMARTAPQTLLPLLDPLRPQFSAAFGRGESVRLSTILARSLQAVLWTSVSIGALVLVAGPFVFRVWTLGKIQYDFVLAGALVASAILYGVSQVLLVFLASIARHHFYSIVSAAAVGVALAGFLATDGGMRGMAFWLLGADVVMAVAALLLARREAPDSTKGLMGKALLPPIWVIEEAVTTLDAVRRRLRLN